MRRLWAFVPFLVVGVIHLAALFLGMEPLSSPTKYFLMPALLVGFLIALPRRRTELALVGSAAIVLSWLGDVLLSAPGDLGFLIGLGFFLLAHLAYIAQFT
ncbi:MAG: lysoplasmalogenase, partial [Microbacteriaceae bacterium]|nr:lysoplasmalogenase [Microbacteriaceae bacterium]